MITIDQLLRCGAVKNDNKYCFGTFCIYENKLKDYIYDETFNCFWNKEKGTIFFLTRTSYEEYVNSVYKFAYINNAKLVRNNGRWNVVQGIMPTFYDINADKYIEDVYTAYKNRLVELQEKYINRIQSTHQLIKKEDDTMIYIESLKRLSENLMNANNLITNLNLYYNKAKISKDIKNSVPLFQLAQEVYNKLEEELLSDNIEPNGENLFYIYMSILNLQDDNKF